MSERIDLDGILSRLGPVCAERAAARGEADGFVADSYDDLRAEGVFAALVPTALGGGGASHRAMCGFLRGLARHCPSTALALSMHQHLVAAAAANDQAGRPGRKVLEKVAGGAILVSTGANDWLDSNGRAERVEGGWRVTGVKPFGSGSPAGDVLVTSAATADGERVLHFPVPMTAEGVTPLGDWAAMGMRGTGSQTLRLDGVFVPDAAVAMERARGPFHPAFAVIVTVAMPLIMSAYVGAAERAAEIARDVARARAAEDPAAQGLAGRMETRLETARLALEAMIGEADGYGFVPSAELASRVLARKTICAEAVLAAGETALSLAGGSGFLRKTGLEAILRDLHGAQFHPLPEPRQALFTGRLALGCDPVSGAADPAEVKAA